MTIFDVLAFKMVTALASSTATVTASDWSAVVDAMTGQISVSTIVATLAVFVGAVIGIVFSGGACEKLFVPSWQPSEKARFPFKRRGGSSLPPFSFGCIYV